MNCPVSPGVGPGVGACTARSIPALMLPHQPAPPHPTHNSITSTTSRNVIVEDPALVERKVPPRCPDLPRKPDLPRSFRSPAYHRTLAYHDAHRRHRGTKGASTQERAQSTISPAGTIRGALRYPAFGRLLLALAVSQLGDWLYNLTLVALVYSRALGAVGRRHHRGAGGGRRHHVQPGLRNPDRLAAAGVPPGGLGSQGTAGRRLYASGSEAWRAGRRYRLSSGSA
jgi:hypothetical protein